jgi:hypothetical protein
MCVTEVMFNLPEVGISHWEDRKTRKVLVSATMRSQTIHHGISWIVKHISVIACISTARESLTPDMITLQDSASVREQLKKHSVQFWVDFVLKSNNKPSINAEIFLDYIQTIFLVLPTLVELRTLDEFGEEIGVSLMDNCPNHVIDDVIHLLTQA